MFLGGTSLNELDLGLRILWQSIESPFVVCTICRDRGNFDDADEACEFSNATSQYVEEFTDVEA
ncbi:hypothetical protein MtrunA17_Chr5g0436531 [Medicago truncatula]|uniref:Uncharacterized protein n=1 Tax=Medicago truncatula TaxID=3880 RepID=A0A396HX00_MEDTR|nr:hypothetical protein MtrunA17_Chr5g0436531 [Medicago truncatula]